MRSGEPFVYGYRRAFYLLFLLSRIRSENNVPMKS